MKSPCSRYTISAEVEARPSMEFRYGYLPNLAITSRCRAWLSEIDRAAVGAQGSSGYSLPIATARFMRSRRSTPSSARAIIAGSSGFARCILILGVPNHQFRKTTHSGREVNARGFEHLCCLEKQTRLWTVADCEFSLLHRGEDALSQDISHLRDPLKVSAIIHHSSLRRVGSSLNSTASARIHRTMKQQSRPSDVGARAAAGDEAPDRQYNDRSDDRANQTRALIGAIPAQSLTEIGGHECADDAQESCENEPRRLVLAGHEELRNHARDKADDQRPNDAHAACSWLGLRRAHLSRVASAGQGDLSSLHS